MRGQIVDFSLLEHDRGATEGQPAPSEFSVGLPRLCDLEPEAVTVEVPGRIDVGDVEQWDGLFDVHGMITRNRVNVSGPYLSASSRCN